MKTTRIREENFYWLEKKFEKLEKKATKLGFPAFDLKLTGERRIAEEKDSDGRVVDRFVESEISFNDIVPIISDWNYVATFKEDSGIILISRKNEEEALPYDPKEIVCEHCGYKRRRVKSFLIQHYKSGKYIQVGSACLRDFTGHDPQRFISACKFVEKIDELVSESFPKGVGSLQYFDLEQTLSCSIAAIKKYGWMSKGEAYENGGIATAEYVTAYMTDNMKFFTSQKIEPFEPSNETLEEARKVIEFFRNYPEDEPGDYITNCIKASELDVFSEKLVGIVCSMPRAMEKYIAKQKEKENSKESKYIGEVGKRYDLDVEFVFETSFDSRFGTTFIYKFVDENGNEIVWFGTARYSMEAGEKVKLRGTVKDHNEYNGVKQTILTRCKIGKKSK